VKAVFVLALTGTALMAQDAPKASPDSSMQESLALQRESVRKQSAAAAAMGNSSIPQSKPAPEDSFFTVSWPTPLAVPGMDCDPMPKTDLDALVRDASTREEVKADLIQAVVKQESGAKPCAVSAKGAMGLMQLMPDVAEQMHVKDPFDPKESVDAGVKLLKELIAKYKGDISLALSAYNAGENRVDQTGGVPDIPETQNYVNSISQKLAATSGSPDPTSPQ
jgi:hypothetical protein